MTSHTSQVPVGIALYVALVMSIYGLSLVASQDDGGLIPLWFASMQILLEAITSFLPGLLVGWLSSRRELMLGAVTGAIGAIVGGVLLLSLWGLPPLGELYWRVIAGLVSGAMAAAVTNAIGAIAGVTLRNQLRPLTHHSSGTPNDAP
jgi:hypothetical protein